MPVDVIYQVTSEATGGRDGHVKSLDGAFTASLTVPKEMGGPGGSGVNPEQLFGSGYAACFLGAMKYLAGQKEGVPVPSDTTVKATVGIGPRSEGGFGLEVALEIHMPETDLADAKALVDKAHQVCPYSNATRGNIDVKIAVI
jgi:Ohr subfamily peroxiredoxin